MVYEEIQDYPRNEGIFVTDAAKDGLLTIILPKLDKARQTKLRVKAG